MISEMAYFFLAILCITFIPILLTSFIGTAVLPFLKISRQEVRDLFLALEDLTLPMGSFPSRLLGLWTAGASFKRECLDSEEDQDEPFFDTFEHQPYQIDEADTRISGVEGGQASKAVEDATEIFFDANQVIENEPTTPVGTDETFGRISADLSRMVTEKEMLEACIRQAVDPKGSRGLAAMDLDSLVRWMMQDYEQSTSNIRLENNKREDAIYDAKQAFEAIIIGQNLTMQHKDHEMGLAIKEATRLSIKNLDLHEESEKAKKKFEERKEKWKRRIETAQREAVGARLSADESTSGVESRIRQLKQGHASEMSAAAFQSLQERNTLLCQMRMGQDTLNNTRRQVTLGEQKHGAAMKESERVKKQLHTTIKDLRLTLAASQELSVATEQRLRKRLEDQSKEKDHEIGTLQKQLRESNDVVKSLAKYEATAESLQLQNQRLSDLSKEQEAVLCANKEHIVRRLNNEIGGHKRTIHTNETTIHQLEGRIVSLESGQEVKKLKVEAQKHLHQCDNENRGLRKQMKALEIETAGLKRTIEHRDGEIQQKIGKWAGEKRTLEQSLKQTKAATDRYMRRKVKNFKKQKQGMSRTLRAARRNEQSARSQVQGLQRDQAQTAAQHQNAVRVAVEEVTTSVQAQLDIERRKYLENITSATERETGLQAEIGALKSQIDGYSNTTNAMSTANADSGPTDNGKDSAILERELDEASSLIAEIEEHGLHKICGERHLLLELNKAKKVLAFIKHEAVQVEPDIDDLLSAISDVMINETRFQQCDSRMRPVLLGQARAANERLRSLQRLFRTTFEVKKDAVLEILQAPAKNETNSRQEKVDLNMGKASTMPSTTMPGVIETGEPPRTLADILTTFQNSTEKPSLVVNSADNHLVPPVPPGHPAHQDQTKHQESGAKGQSFALPNPRDAVSQPPLPGLFQSQSMEQAPLMESLPPRSAKPPRRPVVSQQEGEIRMPRGFTRQMRQWAKGWVRGGDMAGAEALMFKYFPLLKMVDGINLRKYLVELKKFVEGQPLCQMEQPGGWTEDMTTLVESCFQEGQDESSSIDRIKKHASYAAALAKMKYVEKIGGEEEMVCVEKLDGVQLYVEKLCQEFAKKPAQKPARWTDDMTETVMAELRANVDTEFAYLEELLDAMHNFKPDNEKGLMRYLERLKRECQAEREKPMHGD